MLLVAFLLVIAPNCDLSLVLASVVEGDAVNCNTSMDLQGPDFSDSRDPIFTSRDPNRTKYCSWSDSIIYLSTFHDQCQIHGGTWNMSWSFSSTGPHYRKYKMRNLLFKEVRIQQMLQIVKLLFRMVVSDICLSFFSCWFQNRIRSHPLLIGFSLTGRNY